MATDVKIWKGLSEEDFYALMKELTHTFNTDEMWAIYHRKIIILVLLSTCQMIAIQLKEINLFN